MDFDAWWQRVIGRLRTSGIEVFPEPKPVDHEAFEAGMESDEWAWVYFNAYIDDPILNNGDQQA